MSIALDGLRTVIYPAPDLDAAKTGGPTFWVSIRTSINPSMWATTLAATSLVSCRMPTQPTEHWSTGECLTFPRPLPLRLPPDRANTLQWLTLATVS